MIEEPSELVFTEGWEKNWHIADGDEQLAKELLPVFEKYLTSLQEKGVSKSTMNRHKNACLAIGGYIIKCSNMNGTNSNYPGMGKRLYPNMCIALMAH